jgi:octaprenyl-diphosphate synthase
MRPYVERYLQTFYNEDDIGSLPIISSINLARRITKQEASIYKCSPERTFTNVSDEQKKALEEFGRNLGIAFQIADDALDYNPNAKLGKKVGDDFREGKPTLPVIYAYSKCSAEDKKYLDEVFEASEKARGAAQFKKVSEILQQTGAIDYTLAKSAEYSNKAKTALELFKDSECKAAMLDLLDFCVNRNY